MAKTVGRTKKCEKVKNLQNGLFLHKIFNFLFG